VYTAAGVRVLLVNTIKSWGGGESWTEATALALGRRGHDVAVLARKDGPLFRRMREAGVTAAAAPAHPLAQLWARPALGRWVDRLRPDAMLAISGPDLRLMHLLAGQRTGRVFRRGLDRPLGRDRYHRVLLSHLEAIVVNSAATGRTLLADLPDFPAERVHAIPNPVDPERLRVPPGCDVRQELGIAPGAFVVAIVGRLVPQKNHELLFRALKWLPREVIPDWALLVVGGGPLAGRLQADARAQGIGHRCYWLGELAAEEVPAYYAAADVVAVPSRFEGFCYAAVEAALLGKPVVAARVSSLPEVVLDGETGILFPDRRASELMFALVKLGLDPELARRMGERGRAWASVQFAPEPLHARLEAVLLDAARRRAASAR
jgi:glycosyltransferase involved in cell wall biosynthesis